MVTCRVVVVPASFPNLILETELFVIWNTCVFLLPSRQVRWERTNYRWWSRWWRPPPPSPSPSRWSSSKPPLSSPPARLPCYVLINIYQLSWAINYSPPAPLSPSLLHQPSRCCQTFNFKIIFLRNILSPVLRAWSPVQVDVSSHPQLIEPDKQPLEVEESSQGIGVVEDRVRERLAWIHLPSPITNRDADVIDARVWQGLQLFPEKTSLKNWTCEI